MVAIRTSRGNSESYFSAGLAVNQNGTTTSFYSMSALINSFSNEDFREVAVAAMVCRHLKCQIIVNDFNAESTCDFRVEMASVNQTIAITASTTGLFSADLDLIDIVANDNEVAFRVVLGGAGTNFSMSSIGMRYRLT